MNPSFQTRKSQVLSAWSDSHVRENIIGCFQFRNYSVATRSLNNSSKVNRLAPNYVCI